MKAFIVLPKDFDCSCLSGEVDFKKIGFPILHNSIDDALQLFLFNSVTSFIVHIEFLNVKEIVNAVMAAFVGNVCTVYQVRLIETIVVQKNEAA